MIKTVSKGALPVAEELIIQKNRIANKAKECKKRVCIVTGTHGDELEGQYVCAQLAKLLTSQKDKLSGTVDIYPALNPLGIDSVIRGFPMFNLDMNRIFPGSVSGSLAEATAYDIVCDIAGDDSCGADFCGTDFCAAEVCVDIHSSNIFLREIPQVRISEANEELLLPYALMLGTDLVWIHAAATVLESTLAHTLNSRGVKTLVVEMGVGMRITRDYCQQLLGGILNMLGQLGMWTGDIPPNAATAIVSKDRSVGFLNSDASGIFIPNVKLGSQVALGEVVGEVIDPLTGKVVEKALAPCSGLVFTLREYPVVFGGSLLARILEL